MATVDHAHFSWTAPHEYLYPGQGHNWWMVGFGFGDALSVTAYAIRRTSALAVENVRVERAATGDGSVLLFTVRNVGGVPTPGYGVGIGWISH